MKKKEIRNGIKKVYQKLWALLALYEASDCFNEVPAEERLANNPDYVIGEDVWDFVGRKLDKIREKSNVLFLGEPEVAKRLNRIIDETEYFARQYEVPGVADRWKKVNPQLNYFDCAFDFMEENPELYSEIAQGLKGDIHFGCNPDEEMTAARKKYFDEIREKNENGNLRYSEEKIFQNELLHTLTLLFETDFQKYWTRKEHALMHEFGSDMKDGLTPEESWAIEANAIMDMDVRLQEFSERVEKGDKEALAQIANLMGD